MNNSVTIATAGWSVPRRHAAEFPADGTHLQRYAHVLRGVEINTSFYRDHSRDTYARWAAQTPRDFTFAVKLPRAITHDGRLRSARRPLLKFLAGLSGLGKKLGPVLVQLPPSLEFDARVAQRFFDLLRNCHNGPVVCEPRHASWFEERADAMLRKHRIGRVAADPSRVPAAALPGGWPGIVYLRLHGSPRMYWSAYEPDRLAQWALLIRSRAPQATAWCVFDNTASGAAVGNAWQLQNLLQRLNRG